MDGNVSSSQNFNVLEYLTQEDTDAIFQKLNMPSLMLTKLKVKKSKQAIQDAFSVLNHNMVLIDHNMKDLLYLIKDLVQVLFISFDARNRQCCHQIGKLNESLN